ncbi:MAG: hypothetical protein O6940_14125, partial [Ignavibacteria bacterium]|nr:hypothetical protein [Ignavibacteria bacterium]
MPNSLQKMKLSDAERRWLSELHRANFTDVDFKALRIKLRDELPIDFDIESLTEKKLVYDHHITLLGIWHIDKKSTIFQVVEKVIICARDYLFQNHSSKSLSAQEVAIRTNYD